jgi:putative membrane protein
MPEVLPAFDPWTFRAHPDVWVLMAGLAAMYHWSITRLAPRVLPAGTPVTGPRQRLYFWSGLIIMWLASDWPLHDLADSSLYSAHMVQHLALTFVAPPLLLAGMPRWLATEVLSAAGLARVTKILGRAIPAAVIFNLVQGISHSPGFVDLTVESAVFHFGAHVLFVATALLMWMPVVGPFPELRLQPITAMLYLFLQSIIPTVPASWLTFAEQPLYQSYIELPKAFGLDALRDQQAAGLIMKLGGGFYLWGWITVLFFRWAGDHDRTMGSTYRRTPGTPPSGDDAEASDDAVVAGASFA